MLVLKKDQKNVLKKVIQEALKAKGKLQEPDLSQIIELLLALPIIQSPQHALLQSVLTNRIELKEPKADASQKACDEYRKDKTRLTGIISSLFSSCFTIASDTKLSLQPDAQQQLTKNAYYLEQQLINIQNVNSANPEDKLGIRFKASQKQNIDPETWLTDSDISTALIKLAIEYPDKAQPILNVAITNLEGLEATLSRIKESKHYPAHIIINTGSHWTRLQLQATDTDVIINYTDSFKDDDDRSRQELIAPLLKQALSKSYPKHKPTLNYAFTGNQVDNDAWSCGYHALAGVATGLGITHVPESNLNEQQQARSQALRNWGTSYIIGQTLDDYTAELKPSAASQQPSISSPEPKTELQSATSRVPTSFPATNKAWIKAYGSSLGYQAEFDETHKLMVLIPNRSATPQSDVSVTTSAVSVASTSTLQIKEKEQLAENMVKIYIAKELELKDEDGFPSKEAVRQKHLTIKSLNGTDEELKGLIRQKLSDYGIQSTKPIITAPDSSPAQVEEEQVKAMAYH